MAVLVRQQWLDFNEVGLVLAAGRSTNRAEIQQHRIQALLFHHEYLAGRERALRARVQVLNARIRFLEQRLPLMQATLDIQR